jgi:ubiquinone/menaquinone biosynthesis C-methylase UbiE
MSHGRRGWAPDDERRKWQNPEAILSKIGLRPGQVFVDVGCGEGYFALPAARLVGDMGKVYGIDRDAEAICRLRERAAAETLVNLELSVGTAEEWVACNACADLVFFGTVLHDFADPATVLANARKMMKPSGLLIDLDWRKEATTWGPPPSIRFSEDHALCLIEAAGFKADAPQPNGPFHYMIVGRL